MRHLVLVLAALLVSCNSPVAPSPPPPAAQWRSVQLDDLRRAAADGADGLKQPAEAIARLAELQALQARDGGSADQLDQAADDLFRQLAAAAAQGIVDPDAVGADWHIARPPPPDFAALDAELGAGALPSALLQELAPRSAEYAALRAELQRLRLEDPDSARIPQIRANLERWRWLPRDLPAKRVEVRVAEFKLALHRPGQAAQTHAVIVGARRTPSPVFSAEIQSATLNPSWTPPSSIVLNELAPRFARNPAAASREGYDVLDAAGRIVDPSAVNWNARPFGYQLRQRPGPGNALGRLRFDLPNPFAVYLHDTPNRTSFARAARALSHGCVRVESPVALAAALAEAPGWSEAELQAQIETGAQRTLQLPEPVPVYIFYFTTALSPEGEIVYLEDIYRRDQAIVEALDGEPAVATPAARSGPCAP